MKRCFTICFAILLQIACTYTIALAQGADANAPATITVQVDKPGIKVSPTLYGIFFEEINHGGDGGLYAELVQNRSFENSDKPEKWTIVTDGSAKGEIAIDTDNPMCENNSRSLRLKILSGDEGKVGIANDGYWGIAVEKDAQYDLSVAIRSGDGFAAPVAAALISADLKTVYARADIEQVDSTWKTYKLTMKSNATDPKARLIIGSWKPGTLWFDMVSLFPHKTFKDRVNGLRLDLASMLDNLRPSFVRFPGGCWVEGDTMATSMRWKQTIGDVAQRRNLWNLWGYYSPNGLGFYEYLQLCEDLGAEPLFVINCGMSHKGVVPMDKMGEFVQDALDAIEYATGPADSKWGSLRAKAGHPAPFSLKFMEIGNENGGSAYNERYALFYDAIKAKYPKMNLVACDWNGRPNSRPIEIIDEHYYKTPDFFIANANKYDSYDRKGCKVYVGEYAVTVNCGRYGNLRAAIGEAAFMTGMERNSDVVVLASYAPLFVNVNDRKWNPDLIQFDSSRVCGIPSYYVQKMFSQNRGDVVLPTDIKVSSLPVETKHGAIGLGTWGTQAEYKDVKITKGDKVLLTNDFSKDSEGWKTVRGQWNVKNGAFQQTDNANDCLATAGDPSWSDYTLTLKARKISGNEGFFIVFNVLGDNERMWWNLGGWGNTKHAIEHGVSGANGIISNEVQGQIEAGRWYDVRMEVSGTGVRCYLDNKLIHDMKYPVTQTLHAVAGLNKTGDEVILKVVNAAYTAQGCDINLVGVKEVQPSAVAIVLTSEEATDENTLENPNKVAPVDKKIENAGKNFKHSFPANSVTVLRLKIK